MPWRVDAVDADKHLAIAEAAGLDRVGDLPAGLLLGVGRDRVLEIEDHAVDREGLGLLQRAGVGARHVEHAAAWTKTNTLQHLGRLLHRQRSGVARAVPAYR